ncbi:MAG: DUF1992 domain-containing protein [Anaerolineales bacterium]|nr:DUF1992 domain-containing protein [Anaerolineales bacterium]
MVSIEEQIRKAIQEGKFENLAGKGKPLSLDENPFTDPEWRLAYHMLQESGFRLPWMETRAEIEASLEARRQELAHAWQRYRLAQADQADAPHAQAEWRAAQEAFHHQVQELNARIRNYNLEAPSIHLQRGLVSYTAELERVTGDGSGSA